MMMKRFLFDEFPADVAYAVLRITSGLLLVYHGGDKIVNFRNYLSDFPDPLGLGQELSLLLAIFAEFVCGILLTIGLMVRLTAIPLLVTFLVAFFLVHGGDAFENKEPALLYLIVIFCCWLKGGGAFSLDSALFRKTI
jgi:putative oxidoreductase